MGQHAALTDAQASAALPPTPFATLNKEVLQGLQVPEVKGTASQVGLWLCVPKTPLGGRVCYKSESLVR